MLDLPTLHMSGLSKDEILFVLGWLGQRQAEALVAMLETRATTQPSEPSRQLNVDEAATIAGMSRRLLLEKTRGFRFRTDHSRKTVRFDEQGLRSWLARGRR